MLKIIFCVIIIAVILLTLYKKNETFAGAMTQMYAKGPEDHYLTTNTDQYIPPFLYYNNWTWNMPTRLQYPYYRQNTCLQVF